MRWVEVWVEVWVLCAVLWVPQGELEERLAHVRDQVQVLMLEVVDVRVGVPEERVVAVAVVLCHQSTEILSVTLRKD
jgi:hypothetical protein